MNILQILPELNVGGVETGTLDLAKYLVRAGHKAIVVSAGGDLVRELESSGAVHYQLPVNKKSLFTMIKTIPQVVQIIKKEQIDIVHARSRVPAWIAYFACRKTRCVFITTCHGYYSKHIFSYVMGWAKRVIVLSNVIARHMIEDFSVPHERIRLIPRSVDLERFKYLSPDKKRKKEFNVGMIARMTPIKGHLHFIKAMARVSRAIPQLKIWIIGDAPSSRQGYKEQIQVLVKRLGLWHNTQFLGTQRDIPAILAHLDLLVVPTTTQEAFGRVIIEAQAAGVPVIATRVGGIVDIIEEGKTGLLVAPQDSTAIAEATIKIFKDSALARRLSESALEKVKEKYNLELMFKSTLGVYKDALENFKILIIKFSSLGDIILSTNAIKAIREKFPLPHYKISLLVSDECKEVLLGCPYIDELLVCDFKNKDKGLKGLLRLGAILRKKDFGKVIDLQNNQRSHILSRLSLAFARYGYDKKFGFLLNYRIKDEKPIIDPLTHQFRVLKMLGIELDRINLELWPALGDQNYIEELFSSEWVSKNQRFVGINISASQKWLSKNWPLSYITRLCEELSRLDMRAIITGSEKDLNYANILISSLKSAKPINACGRTTVNQLAVLIKRCSVYISPDSAPLHIAAAVGTPFIGLFGPTDPRRHIAPVKNCIVIKKDLSCSPCYKPKCKSKKCMQMITCQEVLEALDKLLAK